MREGVRGGVEGWKQTHRPYNREAALGGRSAQRQGVTSSVEWKRGAPLGGEHPRRCSMSLNSPHSGTGALASVPSVTTKLHLINNGQRGSGKNVVFLIFRSELCLGSVNCSLCALSQVT